MFCRNCGAETNDGSRFCKKCGKELDEEPINMGTKDFPAEKKKKSSKKTVLIVSGVVIAVIVIIIALIGLSAPKQVIDEELSIDLVKNKNLLSVGYNYNVTIDEIFNLISDQVKYSFLDADGTNYVTSNIFFEGEEWIFIFYLDIYDDRTYTFDTLSMTNVDQDYFSDNSMEIWDAIAYMYEVGIGY